MSFFISTPCHAKDIPDHFAVEKIVEIREDVEEKVFDRIGGIKMLYQQYKDVPYPDQIIYFGDSRVVGMQMTGGDQIYVGKVSMGYNWMAGTGKDLLLQEMSAHPDAQIVFCFGVNDVGNIGSYISWFQSFISQYPDREIWYESVNPIEDGKAAACGYFARDQMVRSFNGQLEGALSDRYLDTYSELVSTGFGTQDGVHYDSGTYQKIQDLTKDLIVDKEQEI